MIGLNQAFRFAACSALLSAVAALAQTPAPAAGPVPPAIPAAKKIFVSNAGADAGLFPSPFTGTPDRGYNQFYAQLKGAGHFELVSDPSDADLVLELQLLAHASPLHLTESVNKVNGAADPLPMFRLVVYDRKTHYVLWTMTESIETAYLQKTHDRNFDDALKALLQDFLSIAGKTQSANH